MAKKFYRIKIAKHLANGSNNLKKHNMLILKP